MAFSEKELFILGNQAQVFIAIVALEVAKLQRSQQVLDCALAFTLETLQVPDDCLTDFVLTGGKSTQGVNNFKNSMQALTDKSKLLTSQGDKQALMDALRLAKVYQLHGTLHERVP